MFVDAAAIVAIIGDEPEADRCAAAISAADRRITSPIAVWEASVALARPDAATRFRSGRNRLNLADCFHYACARHYGVAMLSTADEFRFTDLETVP